MSVNQSELSWQEGDDVNSEVITDPLSLIYNEGHWRISKISPLCNLQYTPVKFKQYASKIRQTIVETVSTNSSVQYTVEFKVVPGLKYNAEDFDGLTIQVVSSERNTNKVAYLALLLSWGLYSQLQNAIHLPYMLEKGETKLGTAVKSTLQIMFDCNINQYCFTQHQLLIFGFKLVQIDTSSGTDQFVLSYQTPEANAEEQLDIKFNISDIKIMYRGIRKESNSDLEAVKNTYQVIQNQIIHSMKLDVTVLDLYEITLPKAEVKVKGVVKMKTPDIVNEVFTTLNDISNIPVINS